MLHHFLSITLVHSYAACFDEIILSTVMSVLLNSCTYICSILKDQLPWLRKISILEGPALLTGLKICLNRWWQKCQMHQRLFSVSSQKRKIQIFTVWIFFPPCVLFSLDPDHSCNCCLLDFSLEKEPRRSVHMTLALLTCIFALISFFWLGCLLLSNLFFLSVCVVKGPWKKKCLCDFGIFTQCISPTKINDQYITNVLLKINSKVKLWAALPSKSFLW